MKIVVHSAYKICISEESQANDSQARKHAEVTGEEADPRYVDNVLGLHISNGSL